MQPVIFFAILAAVFLVEAGAGFFPGMPLLVTAQARILQTSLILLILGFSPSGLSIIGLSRGLLGFGIWRGLIWSAGFGLAAAVFGSLLLLFGMSPLELIHVHLPARTWEILLFFGVGGIVAPVAEEIFFRGVLYGYLKGLLNGRIPEKSAVTAAMMVSTLLFALAHAGISGIPVPQLVGGLVFCLAYEMEKTLAAPMVIHCLGNLALFSLGFFS